MKLTPFSGQTEAADVHTAADQDDFLARERAALGEDANQFATPQDHVAAGTNVDTGDDMLGGEQTAASQEIGEFESSFPSMDTQAQNEVRIGPGSFVACKADEMLTAFFQRVAPGGTVTGARTGYQGIQEPEEESEPVKLVISPPERSDNPSHSACFGQSINGI